MDVARQAIDDAKLEMGQVPESEEGKQSVREIERFRVWAKENLGSLAAIAISIAGIITTVRGGSWEESHRGNSEWFGRCSEGISKVS